MTEPLRADRCGAALVLALLMLVVLDCIIIGSLHLSLQEHRIGANRSMLLRLRLDAESGVRLGLAQWSPSIDSMPVGSQHRVAVPAAATGAATVSIERLGDQLFLLHSTAIEPEPRAGQSIARLLVTPPALPPGTHAAAAPLSAAGVVRIRPTGVLHVAAPTGCTSATGAGHAVLVADPFSLVVDPGAWLDGPHGPITAPSVSAVYDRVAEIARGRASVTIAHGDTIVHADTGASPELAASLEPQVLLVGGSLTIAAGAEVRGLVLTRGAVTIEAGALVYGAVHTGSDATIEGEIHLDACAIAYAIDAAGLARPAPAGPRPWLPF